MRFYSQSPIRNRQAQLATARETLPPQHPTIKRLQNLLAEAEATPQDKTTVPYEAHKRLWEIIVFLTGFLTIILKRGGSPRRAAVQAALLGFVPEIAALTLWVSGIFHPLVTNAALRSRQRHPFPCRAKKRNWPAPGSASPMGRGPGAV